MKWIHLHMYIWLLEEKKNMEWTDFHYMWSKVESLHLSHIQTETFIFIYLFKKTFKILQLNYYPLAQKSYISKISIIFIYYMYWHKVKHI